MPNREYYLANKERLMQYQREWREKNARKKAGYDKKYREVVDQDPEKRKRYLVRITVNTALKRGKLVRGKCEVGVDCKGRIEGHHDDYDKPLEVRWLCRKHHIQLHKS